MSRNELDSRLVRIGFQIAGVRSNATRGKGWLDLEETILDACYEVSLDVRLLSLLLSWIKVHGDYVITEKLMKLARQREKREKASPWLSVVAAFAVNEGKHKWKRLIQKQSVVTYLHEPTLVESSIRLKGFEEYLDKLNIRVAKGSLRVRDSDVLTPERLAKKNRQYRNRYLYGASWRADIITAIESGLENPFQIAKTIGCSYEPAYRVCNEYRLAMLVG